MKKVYLFLTDGFEEIEALATVDILRRAGIDVRTVSLTDSQNVVGGHDIVVRTDVMFGDVGFSDAQMFVIPGGTPKFNDHEPMKKVVYDFAISGGEVAAICAAPMVLGGLGLLKGRRATCYPGFEKYLDGAEFVKAAVVVDGNITTGRGPAFACDFALQLVEKLVGIDKRNEVARALLFIE